MSEHVERRATESLLRLIAEGTAPAIGEEFFLSLVRHLAEALRVKIRLCRRIAAGEESTVLLLGETGTGKELVTHALHSLSRRREKLLAAPRPPRSLCS